MRILTLVAISCFTLAACDSKPTVQKKETAIEKAVSTQLDSLEKAKNVEQQLKDNAEKRRREIDREGGQ